MVLFLFVIMLVNVGAEERGTAAIFNRRPQVAAALVFSLLLVLGLLFAINRGYQGLQKRDSQKIQQAASKITIQGARLPEAVLKMSES